MSRQKEFAVRSSTKDVANLPIPIMATLRRDKVPGYRGLAQVSADPGGSNKEARPPLDGSRARKFALRPGRLFARCSKLGRLSTQKQVVVA